MVSFKKFFFATTLLLNWVAAVAVPASTLTVTAADVGTANEFTNSTGYAVDSREASNEHAIDARGVIKGPGKGPGRGFGKDPSKDPNTDPTKSRNQNQNKNQNEHKEEDKNEEKDTNERCPHQKRDRLERRVLWQGDSAKSVKENEFVTFAQIQANGGEAKVVDLTGCTALFFYKDTTLRHAVHILCGNEEKDAREAARRADGSDHVVIRASRSDYLEDATKAVKLGNPQITVEDGIYIKDELPPTKGYTYKGTSGSRDLTKDTAEIICRQPQGW